MEQKTDAPTFESVRSTCDRITAEIERAIIGKTDVIANVLVAFLAGGHILFEDLPGLGKTVAAKSLATALGLSFKRIQFTPDLLPGDITGGYVYNRKDETFVLRKGPIFAHFLLADEINRASPRTQSALLEAMQERHVTIEGETIDLPTPFTVVATQNPIEYEGTFPLPEAQLDRFMVRLSVGYPSADAEQEILRRRRERKTADVTIHAAVSEDEIHAMRAAIEEIHIAEEIERYIVGIVDATRRDRRVAVGASLSRYDGASWREYQPLEDARQEHDADVGHIAPIGVRVGPDGTVWGLWSAIGSASRDQRQYLVRYQDSEWDVFPLDEVAPGSSPKSSSAAVDDAGAVILKVTTGSGPDGAGASLVRFDGVTTSTILRLPDGGHMRIAGFSPDGSLWLVGGGSKSGQSDDRVHVVASEAMASAR